MKNFFITLIFVFLGLNITLAQEINDQYLSEMFETIRVDFEREMQTPQVTSINLPVGNYTVNQEISFDNPIGEINIALKRGNGQVVESFNCIKDRNLSN